MVIGSVAAFVPLPFGSGGERTKALGNDWGNERRSERSNVVASGGTAAEAGVDLPLAPSTSV